MDITQSFLLQVIMWLSICVVAMFISAFIAYNSSDISNGLSKLWGWFYFQLRPYTIKRRFKETIRMVVKHTGNILEEIPQTGVWELTDVNGYEWRMMKFPRPVTWKNLVTKRDLAVDNIYFMGQKGNSDRPIIVTAVRSREVDDKEIIFNDFISHKNVKGSCNEWNLIDKVTKKRYAIRGQQFCNSNGAEDIRSYKLFDNTKALTHILADRLQDQNPASQYQDALHVSNNRADRVIMCQRCGSFLINDGTTSKAGMVLQLCSDCLGSFGELVDSIPHKGTYYKRIGDSIYSSFSQSQANGYESQMSDYYLPIKAEEILEELGNIPKVEKDILILGLGSAGSSILEQLARTKLINTFTLVDFDKIEEKNLRNQIYNRNQIGRTKARGCLEYLQSLSKQAKTHEKKFQDVNYRFVKHKYVVLGFDTIATRLEAFKQIADGTIEAQYIIDTRYDDLESSIYFVDVKDEKQMDYYYSTLMEDLERLKEELPAKPEWKKYTQKDIKWLLDEMAEGDCAMCCRKYLGIRHECLCDYHNEYNVEYDEEGAPYDDGDYWEQDCGTAECRRRTLKFINDNKIVIPDRTSPSGRATESTCVKWNIIDIYKFASSYITSGIREIYEGRKKLFTHVEVNTSGLPRMMVIKK